MNKGLEWLVVLVVPAFVRPVTTEVHHFMRIPVFFLLGNKTPAFQDKDFFSAGRQLVCHGTSTAPGTDDDNIVVIVHVALFDPFIRLLLSK